MQVSSLSSHAPNSIHGTRSGAGNRVRHAHKPSIQHRGAGSWQPSRPKPCSRNYAAMGFSFGTLVHPSTLIGPRVTIGAGSIVMAATMLETDVQLGEHCMVNVSCSVPHECRVRIVHQPRTRRASGRPCHDRRPVRPWRWRRRAARHHLGRSHRGWRWRSCGRRSSRPPHLGRRACTCIAHERDLNEARSVESS